MLPGASLLASSLRLRPAHLALPPPRLLPNPTLPCLPAAPATAALHSGSLHRRSKGPGKRAPSPSSLPRPFVAPVTAAIASGSRSQRQRPKGPGAYDWFNQGHAPAVTF
uniref:Uncharacterized protein n=1 Tax=Zea mays TaxID=4577 RepID=A0A804QUZ9_MAIZE